MLDFQYIRFEQMKANGGASMNTPTTLELSSKVRPNEKTFDQAPAYRIFAGLIANAKASLKGRSNRVPMRTAPGYRLGEAVHHAQFGAGQVKAQWPDGTVLVRFDNETQSRLVFPSLLQGVNGHNR